MASPQLEEMLPKLVLDRGEPALDDGVVVAVAPSAHAPGHAMRLKETLVVFAGIRTALIGVMQEPRGRLATFQCHPQRLDNQVTVVNSTYGPPNEESRVEVEERREIKLPAAADHELGRVPDPPLVRRIGDEVLPEHIGRDGLAMTAYRRALEAFAYSSNEAFCLFQPNHPLPDSLDTPARAGRDKSADSHRCGDSPHGRHESTRATGGPGARGPTAADVPRHKSHSERR